jgi:hypothetical protein
VSGIEVGGALNQLAAAFAEFEGASSGLLGEDDLQEAAAALEPAYAAPARWLPRPEFQAKKARVLGG